MIRYLEEQSDHSFTLPGMRLKSIDFVRSCVAYQALHIVLKASGPCFCDVAALHLQLLQILNCIFRFESCLLLQDPLEGLQHLLWHLAG